MRLALALYTFSYDLCGFALICPECYIYFYIYFNHIAVKI